MNLGKPCEIQNTILKAMTKQENLLYKCTGMILQNRRKKRKSGTSKTSTQLKTTCFFRVLGCGPSRGGFLFRPWRGGLLKVKLLRWISFQNSLQSIPDRHVQCHKNGTQTAFWDLHLGISRIIPDSGSGILGSYRSMKRSTALLKKARMYFSRFWSKYIQNKAMN